MVALGSVFYNSEINFDTARVLMAGDYVSIIPRPKSNLIDRISHFFTFTKDSNLMAVNRLLVQGCERGSFAEGIKNQIVYQYKSDVISVKERVVSNLAHLNDKFIKGSQINLFSALVLRVINFVRWILGKEKIGYKPLDMAKLERDIDQKLLRWYNAKPQQPAAPPSYPDHSSPPELPIDESPGGAIIPFHKFDFLVPKPLRPLLIGSVSNCDDLTLTMVWEQLVQNEQDAVRRLFEAGELQLSDHEFRMYVNGAKFSLGFEAEGDVTLPIDEEELEQLQKALTGSVDDMSRLLTCLVLVKAGSKAIPLLDYCRHSDIKSLEGIERLLLEGPPPPVEQKPAEGEQIPKETKIRKKTLLERVTDTEDPPILKIEGQPFTVRLVTKMGRFVIENRSSVPMYVTGVGIMYRGRYCKFNKLASDEPRVLVNKNSRPTPDQVVEVQVHQDCYYKLTYGNSSFTISLEHLKKMNEDV